MRTPFERELAVVQYDIQTAFVDLNPETLGERDNGYHSSRRPREKKLEVGLWVSGRRVGYITTMANFILVVNQAICGVMLISSISA